MDKNAGPAAGIIVAVLSAKTRCVFHKPTREVSCESMCE